MQTNRITNLYLAALALVLAFGLQPSALFAQGNLTPPGAPGPTMKTLAQIEPRTPISTAPFTITNAGSYYLTTNLTVATGNAITIASSGVTLDLGGFTIASTAPSATGTGILLTNSLSGITVFNGHIRGGVTDNAGIYSGPGFQYGICYSSVAPVNTRVAGVSVSGCQYHGIYLSNGDSTVVESCTVRTVGSDGIMASTIKSSVAVDCGSFTVYGDQVSDSRGECTGSGYGLCANTALNCYGSSDSGYGLYASTVLNCFGQSTSGTGLYAFTAQNCYGFSGGGGYGVFAYTALNCLGQSNNSTGLYAYYAAQNCFGSSSSGGFAGLYAPNASFCTGAHSGGTAIQAAVANGCYAVSGTNNITHKYNMP